MGLDTLFQWLISQIEEIVPFRWVMPDEAGIRIRTVPFFGQRTVDVGPGPCLKLPWLDVLRKCVVKARTVDLDNITVRTRDGVTFLISLSLKYDISHPRRFLLEVENADTSLVVDAMSTVCAWTNEQQAETVTVASLVAACYEPVRKRALKWGVTLHEIGVNSIAHHRVYRLLTS